MAKIDIVDQANKKVGTRELNAAVFGLESDEGFVHRVYATLASAQRAGTRGTKTRADVSGGGKKPFKQKGTGRARQGSTRAAQWRHGGTAHGPQPGFYETRVNKKERRRALCLVLSDALREGKLSVVDKLELKAIKTKDMAGVLKAFNANAGLVVLAEGNREVELSGRNIPNTKVVLDGQLNIHDLLKSDRVILTEAAIAKLEERLS
ncbi:MAG TPA: 50S ribosomal protein L4 [Mariprofundaceae bacterium]|nr:50S ribosomal protein L4 [Mariprofundaceae bacterium]